MDFTYSPEQLELRDRAQSLTDAMIPFEIPCEEGRGLPDASLAEIRRLTLDAPAQRDQHAGRVGRPGTVGARAGDRLRATRTADQRAVGCGLAPGQRAAPLHRGPAGALPAAGDRRGPPRLLRRHRGERGLGPLADRDGRRAQRRRRLSDHRREVVRHRRRRRRFHDRPGTGRPRTRADPVPGRQELAGRQRQANPGVHAHVRVRAPGVPVRRGRGRTQTGCSARSGAATT